MSYKPQVGDRVWWMDGDCEAIVSAISSFKKVYVKVHGVGIEIDVPISRISFIGPLGPYEDIEEENKVKGLD